MQRTAHERLPRTIMSLDDLAPAPPGLGRRGLGFAVAGVAEVAVLIASLLGVFGIGAWRWHTYPNPDPGGFYGAFLIFCITVLLAATIFSVFFAAAYPAWYRAATTVAERGEVERRWSGVLLVLAGVPFFIYGLLYAESVGTLLAAGALLAFASGLWVFFTATPRAGSAGG